MLTISHKVSKSVPPANQIGRKLMREILKPAKKEAKRQQKLVKKGGKNSADGGMRPQYDRRYYDAKKKKGVAGGGRSAINLEWSGNLKRAVANLRIRGSLSKNQITYKIQVKNRKVAQLIRRIHAFEFNSAGAGWPELRHFWGFGFQAAGEKRHKAMTAAIGKALQRVIDGGRRKVVIYK